MAGQVLRAINGSAPYGGPLDAGGIALRACSPLVRINGSAPCGSPLDAGGIALRACSPLVRINGKKRGAGRRGAHSRRRCL